MSFKYWNFVLNFKDPATVYAHSLMSVHHDAMWYLIMILALVYWSLFKIVKDYNWSVFNKQTGSFLIFFNQFFFACEFFFFTLYFNFFFKFMEIYFKFLKIAFWSSMDFNLNPQICSKSNLFSLNFLITSFYNFQKGFEHMLGYSSFEGLVQNRKDQTLFQAFNGSTFSLFKQRLVSLLIEKYIDYFLFNRTNIAYHYHNTQNDKLFLIVQRFHHSTNFEIVCASLPTVIILLILIPSTLLLYSLDEELEPLITYKVVGHQWFWSYEFSNWLQLKNEWKKVSYNFDSCMVTEDELEYGSKRLLEVDKPLFVPVNIPLRFLITSADVLHSWAIPELGVKIDAVPGRLSHYLVLIRRPGFFYGQCSELCGVAHGFMPIVLKAL